MCLQSEFVQNICLELGIPKEGLELFQKKAAQLTTKKNIRKEINILKSILRHKETDWGIRILNTENETLLNNGIYTPLQYLIYLELTKLGEKRCSSYPFLHELICSILRDLNTKNGKTRKDSKTLTESQYLTPLQNVFSLREKREEGSRLSLELMLPLQTPENDSGIDIKTYAQVFGRGVSYSSDMRIVEMLKPKLKHEIVFENHETAPLSAIYNLGGPYPHVYRGRLSIILRNDSHIAIAENNNPILEFYDGGWHVCDLSSGKILFSSAMDQTFDPTSVNSSFTERIMYLAYHMASHWHGGLITVIEEEKLETIFVKQTKKDRENKEMFTAVRNELDKIWPIDEESETWELKGKGRLLLSSAIHDGSLVFTPQGKLVGVGRLVKLRGNQIASGSRRLAGKNVAERGGVAIYISQDGAIIVYWKNSQNDRGVRIH